MIAPPVIEMQRCICGKEFVAWPYPKSARVMAACQNKKLTGNARNPHHVLHLVQKCLPRQRGRKIQAPRLMRRFLLDVALLVRLEGVPCLWSVGGRAARARTTSGWNRLATPLWSISSGQTIVRTPCVESRLLGNLVPREVVRYSTMKEK